ncbi:MAG: hydroxymethylpyrimidine/phosphomethylpyrimidine kinase [bacterium]|jgi:hydroxymethylpyrimidine/phosphomethylpyrimidine kinase
MQHYRTCLTIAGSDSGGGAGIQADLKVFANLKCFGTSVITAITAQNTQTVQSIFPVPTEIIADQLNAIQQDIQVDAIKIGMLTTPSTIEVIAEILPKFEAKVVLDPVMISTSGTILLTEDSIQLMAEKLFPQVNLLTPNLPEAEFLSQMKIKSHLDMEIAGEKILALGVQAVLIKGGHLPDLLCSDCLVTSSPIPQWFVEKRINTKNTHGTGCTLSSAIAGYLAFDEELTNAIEKGKSFLTKALIEGSDKLIGRGAGPVLPYYLEQVFNENLRT